MSIWMAFCLIVVVYLNAGLIDEFGRRIYAILKFEINYWMIRRSIKKKQEEGL